MRFTVIAVLTLSLGAVAHADDEGSAVKATYKKGFKLFTEDGEHELKLAIRNQFRFDSTRPFDDGGQFENQFKINRSRLGLEGHLFGKAHRFKIEFALGDQGNYGFLKDTFIDMQVPGTERTFVRAGLWRRPFSRQELVSDFGSQFAERAIHTVFVGGGRDIGIGIHNDHDRSPAGFEYAVGVFNNFAGGSDRLQLATTCSADELGAIECVTPQATNVPDDFSPAVVLRAGYNSGEVRGYSEADLDGGPQRWAVGAAYKIDLANFTDGTEMSYADNLSHAAEVDTIIKAHGFSLMIELDAVKKKSATTELGVFVQPGYMIVPQHFEVAARFAAVGVDGDRNKLEARAAVNYYWHGHSYKLTTDAGFLVVTGRDATTLAKDKPDLQVRTMLQFIL